MGGNLAFLFDDAEAIGVEEFFQISDLSTEFFTLVGICYEHAMG